ncbi:MAG: tetratricopeptide repeat protein [Myxococcaceae bacterium]|nr:tetratricopeptide repeat protein [Myxococcaceae bacterium]
MSRGLPLLLCLLPMLLAPAAARAQDADEEVAGIRAAFEYGKYAEVLERAVSRINRGGLSEELLVDVHELAGLAAFNLQRLSDAERHFSALLRLDPDHSLDPFVVPPPAVTYFDKLKERMDSELDFLRQERRLRQERVRVEAERRERERLAAEEQRRRAEALARQVTIRTVEKRNFLVNFVPFGAGQFQQGRNSLGVIFAASEGALAVTSVIAYFAYEALFETDSIEIDDVLTETGKAIITVRYIPTSRERQANVWRLLKIGSAAGFYTVYSLGVADALYHHEDQVVTTTIEERPTPAPRAAPARGSGPSAQLRLFPTSGGLGAGLTLTF